MAKTLVTTYQTNTDTDLYLNIFLEGSESDSDWNNAVIYDNTVYNNTKIYGISKIFYSLEGFGMYLVFEGNPNKKIIYLAAGTAAEFNFESNAVLNDTLNKTGNLLMSSHGMGNEEPEDSAKTGFICIEGYKE